MVHLVSQSEHHLALNSELSRVCIDDGEHDRSVRSTPRCENRVVALCDRLGRLLWHGDIEDIG